MKKNSHKLIMALSIVSVMAFAAVLSGVGVKATSGTAEKRKVHVNGKVMGEMGITAEDVAEAFKGALDDDKFGIEFVSEKGPDVEEITVTMQINDADDDNDGTPDDQDNDDNGDGIADNQEVIGTVDLDEKNPEFLNAVHDTRKDQGMNILLDAHDEKHHIVKFETKADPPAEGGTASLKHRFAGLTAHAADKKDWLSRGFRAVGAIVVTARCMTEGSVKHNTSGLSWCISLVAGRAGK